MDILHISLISLVALLLAGLVVTFKAKAHDVEVAVHKWAIRVGGALSRAGASKTVVTPLNDIGGDDWEAAIGHGETAAEYLEQPSNWEKEFMGMFFTALADPVLGPKVKKACADVVAGASKETLQADADDVLSSSPLNDIGAADSELRDTVEHIFHAKTHPELADVFGLLPKGAKFLSKLVVAGKLGSSASPAAALVQPVAATLAAIPDGHILLGPNVMLPTVATSTTSSTDTAQPKPAADGTPAA